VCDPWEEGDDYAEGYAVGKEDTGFNEGVDCF